jgi:hypothetical protein
VRAARRPGNGYTPAGDIHERPSSRVLTVLALKVALAPLLVTLATLSGRRWGATVAGAVTALPIVAGPILAIIAIEHGREFGAEAARSALLGVVALAAACVVFARTADRGWPPMIAAGWLAYGVVAAALSGVDVPPVAGLLIALAALLAAGLLLGPRPPVGPRTPPPSWDLPLRALLTAALVLTLTGLAGGLGPAVSGVLTPFPVATTVMVAFVLAQDGPAAVRNLLHGFVRALPGFALSFFLAALLF